MKIWFTSDTHFNHTNIIKYANRPFHSVEEMNDVIINNWNSLVKEDDIVYHLGDFCFGDPWKYLDALYGNIKIILGSHDSHWYAEDYNDGRVSMLGRMHVMDTLYRKDGHAISLTLNHYAMRSWPLSHYGSWHLFGHHHGKLESYGKSFDVGVDCHNFRPIEIKEVKTLMDRLEPIVDYSKERNEMD